MTRQRSARQDTGDQAGSTASPPSSAVYRVAAIQMAPVLFRKEENVATLLRLTEEAAARGSGGRARADAGEDRAGAILVRADRARGGLPHGLRRRAPRSRL